MKYFLLLFTAILMIGPSEVFAQQEEGSRKSFMQRRQDRAIKNMRRNVRATDHFNNSRGEERQEQEEAPNSMRYLLDKENNKSKK